MRGIKTKFGIQTAFTMLLIASTMVLPGTGSAQDIQSETWRIVREAVRLEDEERALFELGPQILSLGKEARPVLRALTANDHEDVSRASYAAWFLSLYQDEDDFSFLADQYRETLDGARRTALQCALSNMMMGRGRWFRCDRPTRGDDRERLENTIGLVAERGISGAHIHVLNEIYRDLEPTGTAHDGIHGETGDLAFGYHTISYLFGIDNEGYALMRKRILECRFHWELDAMLGVLGILTNDPTFMGTATEATTRLTPGRRKPGWAGTVTKWLAATDGVPLDTLILQGFRNRGYTLDGFAATKPVLRELVRALDDSSWIVRMNAKWKLNALTGHYFLLDKAYGYDSNSGAWERRAEEFPLQERWLEWLAAHEDAL